MPILSRKGLQLPVIMSASVLLSGCVLPEHLGADIVMTGYRYEATLQGMLAEPRTIGALAKGQVLSATHDARMKAQEVAGLALPGMTRFAYTGEGRYEFAMKVEGELTESTLVVGFPNTKGGSNNFLTVRRETDGTVVIFSPEAPQKALADLKEVGLKASGKISINLDGKVLESNADDHPKDGLHAWNRITWQDRVFLRFNPNGC
ncbi:hypothetical protein [Agrobacterium tumefaciens]|uniref:hypothetical protein n=1 Tax=Agrobacterium tumefaciens TaxID=358 RepID=UPI002243A669|nr:hypothetical protein [Agrobacterium tumefaciens]MCW8060155.1 hypothetical protein [Agrobacterium tumefaciens]